MQSQFPRLLCALSIFISFLLLPRDAAAQACSPAKIWTSPPIVRYETVIRDSEGHRTEPNFTVFIELPDGSAASIDPATIRLNRFGGLEERNSSVGDENQNGIADLKVKANRGVLVTGDGLLTVTGKTAAGSCFAGQTTVQMRCLPASVDRSDYFIEFFTSDMPDERLNRRLARIEVHRVRPVFPPNCPHLTPIRALVLTHGRTVPGTAALDLQVRDYSLMEHLALRGIDTFAVNQLGFGASQMLQDNPLDEPCNASLPLCPSVGGSCTAVAGVCDCPGGLAGARMDQQGANLIPRPLSARCAHTSNTSFQLVTHQEKQLDWVVKEVLEKTGFDKIHLLGYSLGGSTIGKYLADDVSRQDKIAGAIFLASTFGGSALPPSPTWPLGVLTSDISAADFNVVGNPSCPGATEPDVPGELWKAIQAQDSRVGANWGVGSASRLAGVGRYPIVPRFGWNDAAASQIAVPALVMNGLLDNQVPVTSSSLLWTSLAAENKTLEQLACASHALMWETCGGDNCVDPHKYVQKRVGDWILTGK